MLLNTLPILSSSVNSIASHRAVVSATQSTKVLEPSHWVFGDGAWPWRESNITQRFHLDFVILWLLRADIDGVHRWFELGWHVWLCYKYFRALRSMHRLFFHESGVLTSRCEPHVLLIRLPIWCVLKLLRLKWYVAVRMGRHSVHNNTRLLILLVIIFSILFFWIPVFLVLAQ